MPDQRPALLDEISTAGDLALLTAGSIVSDRFGRAWRREQTGPGWSDEQLLRRAPLTVLYVPEWRAQAKAEALREAASDWSDWDGLSAPEEWLRDRADAIENGADR